MEDFRDAATELLDDVPMLPDETLADAAFEFDDEALDPDALTFLDPTSSRARIDAAIGIAAFAQSGLARRTAELWHAVLRVVDEAQADPSFFIDPRAVLTDAERHDYAERAAVADLAVRMRVGENTVRTWAGLAQTLRAATPQVWDAFRNGRVAPSNARIIAETVRSLPDDAAADFDAAVLRAATTEAPGRLRRTTRALRERLHARSIAERHAEARERRRVVLEHDVDGMSWLSLHLASSDAEQIVARMDATARGLAELPSETRSLDQRRADVATDLLLGGTGRAGGDTESSGRAFASPSRVCVTVPVLTLLGSSDEPGVLDGVGPIDADTARELAGGATSFTRLLTHPVSGTVLALDRETYRVPADLQRAVRSRDRTCRFPGCTRAARGCDLDHVGEWQDGGGTDLDNLLSLCRHHHRLKSVTTWAPTPPDPTTGDVRWTSPTGVVTDVDPPPF